VSSFADVTDVHLEVSGGEPLSASLVARVDEACTRIEDAGAKGLTLVVHIRGVDPADRAEPWPHETAIHLVTRWERALHRLERLPAVVVAVVDEGVTRGPAFDLLLATDYRVAAAEARLELAESAGGAWPGLALYRLTNQLGASAARRLLVRHEALSAARATEVGVIDEVAAGGDDAVARVREVLHTLNGLRGKEFAVRRQLILEAGSTTFDDALGPHLAACDRSLRLARQGLDGASVPDGRL
jgi:isomerase DpgB